MSLYPLNKLIHLRKTSAGGVTAIYFNTTLRTLAFSLISIFFPIFIFIQTREVFSGGIEVGLYGVVAYFFLFRFTVLSMLIPSSKLLSRIGFRWTMLISSIASIVLMTLLSLAENYFWILPIVALAHGVQSSLYWLSYRSLFVKDGATGRLGEEVSTSAILGQIAAVAGPVLGGLIIATWGFSALFVTALIIVVFSGVPFFFMKRHKNVAPASFSSVVSWFKKKEHRNEEVSFLGRRIDDNTSAIFWPIFVFLIIGAYEKQGMAASLGLIASTLMIYISGKIFDKKHSHGAYKLGVISTSLLWLVRLFIRSLNQLIGIEISLSLFSPMYWVTYDSLLYERARDEGGQVLTFMVSRMIMACLSAFVVLFFVLLVASFEWRFFAIFGLASLGTLLTMAMWEETHG